MKHQKKIGQVITVPSTLATLSLSLWERVGLILSGVEGLRVGEGWFIIKERKANWVAKEINRTVPFLQNPSWREEFFYESLEFFYEGF